MLAGMRPIVVLNIGMQPLENARENNVQELVERPQRTNLVAELMVVTNYKQAEHALVFQLISCCTPMTTQIERLVVLRR